MYLQTDLDKHRTFDWDGIPRPVRFVERLVVAPGVMCFTYAFVDDPARDLALVHVAENCRTPLQKVLQGTQTIEGFVSGRGTLTIGREDGHTDRYAFPGDRRESGVAVVIGQTMQWVAPPESALVFYEICMPPYRDGRYENLPSADKA